MKFSANTSNCLWMMNNVFNPNFLAFQLVSQALNPWKIVEVAQYGDCSLWIRGGDNTDNMGINDAFIIGNYDLAEVVLDMVNVHAGLGKYTELAACNTIDNCPVYDVSSVNAVNKTGHFALDVCVGGPRLPWAAWAPVDALSPTK